MDDDHIPMKDEFSGDESEIEILEKEDEMVPGETNKIKKIKKRAKNFTWKLKWVPISNSVENSQPLFIRRWVKIKLERPQPEEPDSQEEAEESPQKPNGNIRDIAAQIIDYNEREERKGGSE